jgi:hypothetical protein
MFAVAAIGRFDVPKRSGRTLSTGKSGSPICETLARTEQPEQPRRHGLGPVEAALIGSISAGTAAEFLGQVDPSCHGAA